MFTSDDFIEGPCPPHHLHLYIYILIQGSNSQNNPNNANRSVYPCVENRNKMILIRIILEVL